MRLWMTLVWMSIPSQALAGGSASSFKKEVRYGTNLWNIHSLIDGKLETCWMPARESKNVGEWVMLEIPKSTIDKIGMNVGWEKSDATWSDYPRVKAVTVQAFSYDADQNLVPGKTAKAQFADERGWQVVDIADLSVGSEMWSGKVKVTIAEVYPGHDFDVLGASELQIYLKEFDAKITVLDGSGVAALTDGNPRTTWQGTGPLTIDSDGFAISSVGLVAAAGSRPKTVKVQVGGRSRTQQLSDAPGLQWIELPGGNGYNGGAWGSIELEVVDTFSGADAIIGELKGRATAYEGI